MKKRIIIGVMGGGSAAPRDTQDAYRLGSLIAKNGWILLNGGRSAGVMEASAQGADDHGGTTVGILPDENHSRVSAYIQIPILTGMGSARNCINVLSSNIVVACPGGAGTLSEVALALKYDRKVILLNFEDKHLFEVYHKEGKLFYAHTPEEVIDRIKELLSR